jgi:hypothetical protein
MQFILLSKKKKRIVILSISNEMLGFKIDVSNSIYEINVDTSF